MFGEAICCFVFSALCFCSNTYVNEAAVQQYIDTSQDAVVMATVDEDSMKIDVDLNPILYEWKENNDGLYYYDRTGVPKTGWFQDGGNHYFLQENGRPYLGWYEENESKYYFDDNGVMLVGWQDIDNTYYHFDKNGAMTIGWLEDEGEVYYLDASGHVSDGWQTIDDVTYYFDAKGRKQTGATYVAENDATYYLYSDGWYATDTVVDGNYYGSDGKQWSEYYDASCYLYNGNATYFNKEYGGWGRLYIPDVGINVALYHVAYNDDTDAQWIVDSSDSAAYMTGWGATPFIGDHTNQGFNGIRNCGSGTKAFIRHGGNTYVYSCYYVGGGTNDGYYVYDWNGTRIWDHGSSDIAMYTCNGNWQNVSIVLFSLIDVL